MHCWGSWPAGRTSDELARAVCELYDMLRRAPDLRPGNHVDVLFRRLVRLVTTTPPDRASIVMAHPDVRAIEAPLRALCCEAEYELELAWARRIAESPSPSDELARFPYVGNYFQLGRMERTALAGVAGGRPIRRVAFVGSGPLPLTSFLLAAEGNMTVDNLDRESEAVVLSARVAEALGVDGALSFRQVEVDASDLGAYDLVVLAALVGLTAEEKQRTLAHLARTMAPGALLLARSARGLRTLLYPAIDMEALGGFDLLGVVHPTHEVINSVVLARRR